MIDEDDFDPDDQTHYGTGDKFGNIGPFEIYDDGAMDPDMVVKLNGERLSLDVLATIRAKAGDRAFMEMLVGVTDDGEPEPDDFESRPPVAKKCSGCNETFPRTMLEDGKCPDCGDHE